MVNSLFEPVTLLRKTYLWVILVNFVLLFGLSSPVLADNRDNGWQLRNPLPQGYNLKSTAYGSNTFVSVGEHGTILTSPDGITWTSQTSGMTQDLCGVTYGKNTFVSVGAQGTILTSPDGITWTSQKSGTTDWLGGITYGNNTFMVVGEYDSKVFTSPNGIFWTSQMVSANQLYGVTYGNNTFVAIGYGEILTSPNGVSWTSYTTVTSTRFKGATYANGTFVVVGRNGTILTSPDGIVWTSQTSGITQDLCEVTYGGNTFVAVGAGGTILTSLDGITWTSLTSGTAYFLDGVVYGKNTFVAVGGYGAILTSPDGITWTSQSAGTTDWLGGITYGNNTFVAVGGYGTILTSPDGVTWTSITSGTTNQLVGVTYGNNTFVALGRYDGKSTILTSPDGITWSSQTSGTTNRLYGVTYAKNTFVAVGVSGTILTSPDGISWTGLTTGSKDSLLRIAYGNNTFVAVGYYGRILTSTDGITWTNRTLATLYGSSKITYGNKTFVVVNNSEIFTSLDGITWTRQISNTTGSLYEVTYSNGTFVAVGENGIILTSPDGISWSTRRSNTVRTLDGVTYGNNTFVAVGDGGTVLQSQLAITNNNLVSGKVGSPYNITLAVSGGTAPYTWSAIGLPDGFNIESSSGTISGTPTEASDSLITATVIDRLGQSAFVKLSLSIYNVLTVINTNPPDNSLGVDPSKNITITFNMNINLPKSNNITIKDNTLTIKPPISLAFSTKYTIIIRAGSVKDVYGHALAKDYSFSFTTMGKPPLAPTNLSAKTCSSTEIDLSWKGVTDCKYNVYRLDNNDNGYQLISGNLEKASFIDMNLKPDTTYLYKVTAINSAKVESAATVPVKALTKAAGPEKLKTEVAGVSEIDLSWDPVSGANSYIIYRSASEAGKYTKVGSTKTISFNSIRLTACTSYWYKVTAVTVEGESDYSNNQGATTQALAPSGVKAKTVSSSSIALNWKSVKGNTYNLYRSSTQEGVYEKVAQDLSTAPYNDHDLAPGTTYRYKVKALNAIKDESVASIIVSAATKASGPINLKSIVKSKSEIYLSWDTVSGGVKSYNIYRATVENGRYSKVGMSKTESFKSSKGLALGKTCWYKVTAVTSTGEGDYSEAIIATTL